jgi:hypothetical protein
LTAIGTGRALAAVQALRSAQAREHPLAHLDDEAALLEHVYELRRRHRPALGMIPAQQRLAAAGPHGAQVELRLVGERELPALERPAQVRAEERARPGALVDLGREELVGVARTAWRGTWRRPGPEQAFGVAAVGRVERMPTAPWQHLVA